MIFIIEFHISKNKNLLITSQSEVNFPVFYVKLFYSKFFIARLSNLSFTMYNTWHLFSFYIHS